jgi:predicted ATP-grasp superfamily ATP-dependent carboligase
MTRTPAALLFLGDHYGTLATARCLASHGVDVHIADASHWSRTAASRAVTARHVSPSIDEVPIFLDWLRSFGRAHPGTVLYPANDGLAFVFAQHKAELSEHFRLYLPDFDTIFRILNKQRLHEACERVGIDIPRTFYPRGEDELRALLDELDDRPYLLKPKTQIQLASGIKAAELTRGEDAIASFSSFVRDNPYGRELLAHDAEIRWPMVQEFLPNAAAGIYSLAGFIDREHDVPLARASKKILQRPRKLGIGLCFEAAPVSEEIARSVGALCRELGYYGPFELEFVAHEGRLLLIDFNPRIYSQLAFEIARALPTPWLQYLAATDRASELAVEWGAAAAWSAEREWVYTHETLLSLVVGTQLVERATKRLDDEDWSGWVSRHRGHLVDAVRDGDDLGPVFVDAVQHVKHFVRHPRSFLRSFAR